MVRRIVLGMAIILLTSNAQALVRCPNGMQTIGVEIPGVTPPGLPRLPNWGPFPQDGIKFLFFCDIFGNPNPSGAFCSANPAMCILELVWKRFVTLTSFSGSPTSTVVEEDRAFDGAHPNRQRCMLNEAAAYRPWQFTRAACNTGPRPGVVATYQMLPTTDPNDTPPDVYIP